MITSWNPAAERMYGYSPQEAIGRPGACLTPQGREKEFFANLDSIKDGKPVKGLENVRVRKDGVELPVSITISPICNQDGEIVGASAVHRDVTEQRRAFEVGQHMAAMVQFSAEAMISATLDGIIRSWNPAAEKLYGYTSKEVVGKSVSQVFPPDRLGEMDGILDKIRAGHSVVNFETVRLRRDRTAFPASLTISPIHDSNGSVVAVDTIAHDVTQQRRAFEAAQRIAAIVDGSDDAIIGRTLEGTITSWNPAAEKMFGYSGEEITGRSTDVLIPHDRRNETGAILARVRAGRAVQHIQTTRVRKDGTVFPVSLIVSPIRTEDGVIAGSSVSFRDMTDQEHAARYARSLIQAALDPMLTIGAEGRITDVNEASINITGVPRERLIGSDYAQYVTEPEKALVFFEQVFEKGSMADYPLTVRHVEGTLTDIVCNGSIYRDIGGEVLGVFAAGHDVTRQKQGLEVAQHMAAIVRTPRMPFSAARWMESLRAGTRPPT